MSPKAAVGDVKRILVAVDFSSCSRGALEHAIFFSERYLSASLEVLHVVGPAARATGAEPLRSSSERTRLDEMSTSPLAEEMERLLQAAEERGLKVRRHQERGDPVRRIVGFAEREGCDLIFMGTHGRTGIEHQLLGSVAELVVRFAPCPVMTVRARPRRNGALTVTAST